MRPPVLLCCAPQPHLEDWGRCAPGPNLEYHQVNETAAEGPFGYDSGLDEASMKRGDLVFRPLRPNWRPCPCILMRIENA